MVQMINGESSSLFDKFVSTTKKKNFFASKVDVPVKKNIVHQFCQFSLQELFFNTI